MIGRGSAAPADLSSGRGALSERLQRARSAAARYSVRPERTGFAEYGGLDFSTLATWIAGAAVFVAALSALLQSAQRQRNTRLATDLWVRSAPADRRRLLDDFIDLKPETAAAHYLYGCACLREGDVAAAARAFGAAYHADYRLESAAMLTFACLKAYADEAGTGTLRQHVLTTWDEMKRHRLAISAIERSVIEALGDSARAVAAAWRPPALDPGRAAVNGAGLDAAQLLDRILALPEPVAARKNSP